MWLPVLFPFVKDPVKFFKHPFYLQPIRASTMRPGRPMHNQEAANQLVVLLSASIGKKVDLAIFIG
jgi:hypothetical protein